MNIPKRHYVAQQRRANLQRFPRGANNETLVWKAERVGRFTGYRNTAADGLFFFLLLRCFLLFYAKYHPNILKPCFKEILVDLHHLSFRILT